MESLKNSLAAKQKESPTYLQLMDAWVRGTSGQLGSQD